jgi:hypothetical protein
MTLATISPDRARYIANSAEVAAKERRLLEVLREHPGLTVPAIAKLACDNKSATDDRLLRLFSRGAVEKDVAGRWRITGGGAEEKDDEPKSDPRAPDPGAEDPTRWVKPLSCYERRETTILEGLRYG